MFNLVVLLYIIILILGFGRNKMDSNCCWNILGQNTATYQQSVTKFLLF